MLRQKVIELLRKRFVEEISRSSSLKVLTEHDPEKYIDHVLSTLYLYTRPKKGVEDKTIYFVELILALGSSVRSIIKFERDTALTVRVGAFVLYSFEQLGVLKILLGKGKNNHQAYVVKVVDDDEIVNTWKNIVIDRSEKFPSLTPYAPWTSYKHETGALMVKTTNSDVLKALTPDTHPIVFSTLNKAQEIGWKINEEILKVATWGLTNKISAFADIWEQQKPEAKATKLREAKMLVDLAKRFNNKIFYHLYTYDFRGRKYPNTAYLHEQGTDLAKALLLPNIYKPMGFEGYQWLLIQLANEWGGPSGRADGLKTDKIPIKDRVQWALDNEEMILMSADNPKKFTEWMKADAPWRFLACCLELKRLRLFQYKHNDFERFDLLSNLPGFIDGSNNGSQHLAALTRDEQTAELVNIVPCDLPRDLYKYVADYVWDELQATAAGRDKDLLSATDEILDEIIKQKKEIFALPFEDPSRASLTERLRDFRELNKNLLSEVALVYWLRITDNKHKRKIVKRNVMTLPYGGTPYGLGEQQIKDAKKHGIEYLNYMEHRWGAYLGRFIFECSKLCLKRPMQLLTLFEEAGKKAEEEERFLSWVVPITNFPVTQNYTEGSVRKVWVQYGPPKGPRLNTKFFENTYQINVAFPEYPVLSKGKQESGASPNAIHSLDAAHLMLIVDAADFPVFTIHDSFGSLLADMPSLFKITREQFLRLYKENPLPSLLAQIGADESRVSYGTLDVSLILDAEYAFI